jgi:casein kinase II subunit beta
MWSQRVLTMVVSWLAAPRTDLVLSSAITESSSPSTNTSTLTWITWFCSLPGHEYFCEVAEVSSSCFRRLQEYWLGFDAQDFIEDDFNLTGLNGLVPFYKEAMEMVLDVEAGEFISFP